MADIEFHTQVGVLTVTEVYAEFDGPRLFACHNSSGQLHLCMFVARDERGSRWMLIPMSWTRLAAVRSGRLSLREAMVRAEDGWVWIARTGYDIAIAPVDLLACVDIDPEYLPDEDAYLALPDVRLPVIEESVEIEAQRNLRDTAYLYLRGAFEHAQVVAMSALAGVLSSFQNLIYVLADPEISPRGRIPAQVLQQNRLLTSGFVAGSFGVRLEASCGSLVCEETQVARSLRAALTLIDTGADPDTLRAMLISIRPRAANRYRNFLQTLRAHNLAIGVSLGTVAKYKREVALDSPTIRQILDLMDRQSELVEERHVKHGLLSALDTDAHKFSFRDDGGERYHGEYDPASELGETNEESWRRFVEGTLAGVAVISETLQVQPMTGAERLVFRLIEFTPDA